MRFELSLMEIMAKIKGEKARNAHFEKKKGGKKEVLYISLISLFYLCYLEEALLTEILYRECE